MPGITTQMCQLFSGRHKITHGLSRVPPLSRGSGGTQKSLKRGRLAQVFAAAPPFFRKNSLRTLGERPKSESPAVAGGLTMPRRYKLNFQRAPKTAKPDGPRLTRLTETQARANTKVRETLNFPDMRDIRGV